MKRYLFVSILVAGIVAWRRCTIVSSNQLRTDLIAYLKKATVQ